MCGQQARADPKFQTIRPAFAASAARRWGRIDRSSAFLAPRSAYDPKGLFILRWYKEVDKDGKELKGYQNKECFAYKLMANNDGDVFAWTSNVQLISKVYLKKHTSMGHTYTLNKKDSKMVGDAMKKKL